MNQLWALDMREFLYLHWEALKDAIKSTSSLCKEKILENESSEEINCQLNSWKSRNFSGNHLLQVLFDNFNPGYGYF